MIARGHDYCVACDTKHMGSYNTLSFSDQQPVLRTVCRSAALRMAAFASRVGIAVYIQKKRAEDMCGRAGCGARPPLFLKVHTEEGYLQLCPSCYDKLA